MKKTILLGVVMALLLLSIVTAANESVSVTTIKCLDGAFEIVNNSIKCVTCAAGFEAVNGTCILKAKQLNTETSKDGLIKRFEKFIDDNGTQIAPANPALGKVVLFVLALVFLFFFILQMAKIVGFLKGEQQ